jgi:L-ascorbate metabolism protein UlaG (beta-lactamase superfamily)
MNKKFLFYSVFTIFFIFNYIVSSGQEVKKTSEDVKNMVKDIHWLGQSAFKITGEKIVYFDPYRLSGKQEKADIILISHSHSDHCSPEDVKKIQKSNTIIVAPSDCKSKLSGNVETIKPGDKVTIEGINIEAVPAYNVNKKFHPKENNWVGYIITISGRRIYHCGDTDKIPEMANIKSDVVLIPIGGTYTMTAEEAADAVNLMKPKLAIPMHYGSIVGTPGDAVRFKEKCTVPVEILSPESEK